MEWWRKSRNISVVVDTPGWFDPFAEQLVDDIRAIFRDNAQLFRSADDVLTGGCAFFLSCCKLVPAEILKRNHINLVAHASALPKGRGFSPAVYQVLEGKNRIPVTLFEAVEEVDAGDIFLGREIELKGHELNDEIRASLGTAINQMILQWLEQASPRIWQHPQEGEPSWYPRRRPEDSRLDPDKTIAEQFDLLRVVDNERYPAFLDYRGHRYILTIKRQPDSLDTPPSMSSRRQSERAE
jgi:methionyl-tRNA formyltransferase